MNAWNNSDLREKCYPFVLVDAFELKVREDGRDRYSRAMIAIGINTEGYREDIGLMLGDRDSEASWSQFFSWLKSSTLRGVELVVSDDHGGLVTAVRRSFQGVTWNR